MTKLHMISGFFYPKVVETRMSFKACDVYSWSSADAVELKYFNSSEQIFLALTCDEHLSFLFSLNADSRFGKIHIAMLQPRKEREKGKGV